MKLENQDKVFKDVLKLIRNYIQDCSIEDKRIVDDLYARISVLRDLYDK